MNTSRKGSTTLITTATFAAMTLLYTLFAKFVPIISIWEMRAGAHPTDSQTAETH